jgi:hypothetical protein
MQLCSDGHGEVAFVGSWYGDCPACSYVQEVQNDMQESIDALREEIDNHECE